MSACSSSGVSIIITSAHLAASATSITLSFSPSAFLTPGEPLRSATATSLTPRVAQVQRMGVALAAVADDGDLLALDQVQVGVAVVVNTHGLSPLLVGPLGRFVLWRASRFIGRGKPPADVQPHWPSRSDIAANGDASARAGSSALENGICSRLGNVEDTARRSIRPSLQIRIERRRSSGAPRSTRRSKLPRAVRSDHASRGSLARRLHRPNARLPPPSRMLRSLQARNDRARSPRAARSGSGSVAAATAIVSRQWRRAARSTNHEPQPCSDWCRYRLDVSPAD